MPRICFFASNSCSVLSNVEAPRVAFVHHVEVAPEDEGPATG